MFDFYLSGDFFQKYYYHRTQKCKLLVIIEAQLLSFLTHIQQCRKH